MQFDRGYLSPLPPMRKMMPSRGAITDTRRSSPTARCSPFWRRCADREAAGYRRRGGGRGVATLVVTSARGLKVAAVKAPGFGDRARPCGRLAVLTNGRSSAGSHKPRRALEMLGRASGCASEGETTHRGAARRTRARPVSQLNVRSRDDSTTTRRRLQERPHRLAAGVAVIKVEGHESGEGAHGSRRRRANATRAAVRKESWRRGVSLLGPSRCSTTSRRYATKRRAPSSACLQATIRQIAEKGVGDRSWSAGARPTAAAYGRRPDRPVRRHVREGSSTGQVVRTACRPQLDEGLMLSEAGVPRRQEEGSGKACPRGMGGRNVMSTRPVSKHRATARPCGWSFWASLRSGAGSVEIVRSGDEN